jgi:hypothetical protein
MDFALVLVRNAHSSALNMQSIALEEHLRTDDTQRKVCDVESEIEDSFIGGGFWNCFDKEKG